MNRDFKCLLYFLGSLGGPMRGEPQSSDKRYAELLKLHRSLVKLRCSSVGLRCSLARLRRSLIFSMLGLLV